MAQLAYLCEGVDEDAGPLDVLAATVSLFGEAHALAPLIDDVRARGLSVGPTRPLRCLLEGDGIVLGDIVLVECSVPGGAELAALVRLDERAARSGAQLVVATAADALDDVFGCLEQADCQILVDPTAAQRALALGSALIRAPRSRVRELDQPERLALSRLTEEVGRLAAKLDRLALPLAGDGPDSLTARLASPRF